MKASILWSTLACVGLAVAGLLIAPTSAHATCPDPADEVDSTLVGPTVVAGGSALSAPIPHPTLRGTVVAAGGLVHIRNLSDGTSKGVSVAGTTISGAPNPVTLEDTNLYIFIVRDDGILEKLDASGASEWTVDLARGTAGTSDGLSATPAIHLNRFASASFQAKYPGIDLVYVATRYGGTDATTANRVYAINADTGAVVWIFNSSPSVDMDVTYEAPFIDYDNDRLIVGTDRSDPAQDSLWSIDVITGTKAWSANVGQIWTSPVLRGTTIYVATLFGDIKALSSTDGSTLWSVPTAVPITTNIFPEFRPPYAGLIAYVNFFGEVGLVRDDVTSGTVVWTEPLVDPDDGVTTVDATSRVAIAQASAQDLGIHAPRGDIHDLDTSIV